jgi:hypothetical protein
MLKKWQQGHNEYFSHLEHVARLPDAYEALLFEIVRRRAFNNAYEARISVFANEIAAFRSAETRYTRRCCFTSLIQYIYEFK